MTHGEGMDRNVKQAKKPWMSETQARFLQSQNAAWLSAAAQGPGVAEAHYSEVAKQWMDGYGWRFDRQKDLKLDPRLESRKPAEW